MNTNKPQLDKYNDKSNTTTQQQLDSILVQYFYIYQNFTVKF